MRALTCILLLATVLARGEVPTAWPDAPDGRIVSQWNSLHFDGGLLLDGEGGALLAWNDAREGSSRVRVQRLGPDGDGLWGADGSGLLLPRQVDDAYGTLLTADGSGGSLVAWQEWPHSSQASVLLLQRVVDGAAAWAEPTELGDDVWTYVPSLAATEAMDDSKALVGDGGGGAWVLWRIQEGGLRIQHVEGDGSLDSDFPYEGLWLEAANGTRHLVADGQGGVWIVAHRTTLQLLHLGADGSRLPAEGWLMVAESPILGASASSVDEQGRLALAWTEAESAYTPRTLRLQTWDAELDTGHPSPLDLAVLGVSISNLKLSATAGQMNLGWQLEDAVFLQSFADDGVPLWATPVDIDRDGFHNGLLGLLVRPEGPVALLSSWNQYEGRSTLRLEALDWQGGFRWTLEDTRVAEADWFERPAARTFVDGCWLAWGDESGQHVALVDDDGQSVWPEGARRLAAETGDLVEWTWLVDAGETLVIFELGPWMDWLQVRRLSRETGLQMGEVARFDDMLWIWHTVKSMADGSGGAWLIASMRQQLPDGTYCSAIQGFHVLADGQTLGPLFATDLVTGPFCAFEALAATESGLVIGYSQGNAWLQLLDWDGSRLWDAGGVSVLPQPRENTHVKALAPRPSGGVDVFWQALEEEGPATSWLQSFDGNGQRLIEANGGRGHSAGDDLSYSSFYPDARLWHQPGGGILLSHYYIQQGIGTRTWRLFAEDGALLAAEDYLSQSIGMVDDVLFDRSPDGGWRAAWSHLDGDAWAIDQVVWNPLGERIDEFSTVVDDEPDALCGGWPLSLVSVWQDPDDNRRAVGYGPAVSDGPMEPLWEGILPPFGDGRLEAATETGTDGALALALLSKMPYGGYGGVLRLQLIQAVDPAVAVDDPAPAARPQALRLVGAAPNPFNPSTWIAFELGAAASVRLEVFDILGRRVRMLDAGPRGAGEHRLLFDASASGIELASGIYVYRLRAGGESATGRLLLLR